MTIVWPIGNELPLGGLQLTKGGGLQPPVAVLVKNTTVPLVLVVVTVRFDEQVRLIGGRATVTVNPQLVNWPQESLAVQVTIVLPIGNALPLGGLQLTKGGGLQPPVAVLVKNTATGFELVADTVILDEQVRLMGGRTTVTVNPQLVN